MAKAPESTPAPAPERAPLVADAERLLGLVGLGRRARTIVVGVDGVRTALQGGQCECVILAADASPRALEKVVRLAAATGVPLVTGPSAVALGDRLGKPPVMAVGVRDRALAKGIVALGAGRL